MGEPWSYLRLHLGPGLIQYDWSKYQITQQQAIFAMAALYQRLISDDLGNPNYQRLISDLQTVLTSQ